MKVLKVFLYIIFAIILISAILFVSLYVWLDPTKLKPVIIQQVKTQTGYDLAIDGNLSWTFYPMTAITVKHMTLSNANQNAPFVDLSGVKIATPFSQLIHGKKTLQGQLNIADIKLFKIQMKNVHLNIGWKNKILSLNPISADFYQGKLSGSATGSELFATPHWAWDIKINNVQLKPLLQDVNGSNSKLQIDALAHMKLQASTLGKKRDEVLAHLNGASDFSLNKGTVEGIDLNYLVQLANALLTKHSPASLSPTGKTAFDSFTGSILIKNGVASTNNLLLTAPAFVTNGDGNIELQAKTINLHLQVQPKDADKVNWRVPILISGKVASPDIRLDTALIQENIIKDRLQKIKIKAVEKIKAHINGDTGKIIKNLLQSIH